MLCELSSVTEASEGGLKLWLVLMVKCSCLEVLVVSHRQLCMKSETLWVIVVLLAQLGSVELVL